MDDSRHALLWERLGLAVALLALTALLIRTDAVWRWDQAVYDALLQSRERPAADDIVIIAIDGDSIADLGAWPWPRQRHAQLLRTLEMAAPRAILLDIIFAEPQPGNAQGDRDLAAAIRASGKVFLPVLAEQARQQAPLSETLPLPMFAEAAAGLGHTHIELDPDGMARGVYLQAGLGSAAWPSFGLAALRGLAPGPWARLPGQRDPDARQADPYTWAQDYRVLIPFAGPPGTFHRVSYRQVAQGEVLPAFFRDKIVLVGATASGLGDALPTPVSGFGQPMPGVEIHANLIDALRLGLLIEPLPEAWRLGVSLGLALLPALLFPHLSPRGSLLATVGLLLLVGLGSWVALVGFHVWFAPVPVLLALAVSHPLWSWRRLEYAMRYLNRELHTLAQAPTVLSRRGEPDIAATLAFLRKVLPVEGWLLLAADGGQIAAGGVPPVIAPANLSADGWLNLPDSLWAALRRDGQTCRLGLHWQRAEPPTPHEQTLLDELLRHLSSPLPAPTRSAVEMVEARIQQVQAATAQLRNINQVVADSLAEMADGVLIADAFGHILLANANATAYLPGADVAVGWADRSLAEAFAGLELAEQRPLGHALAEALVEASAAQFYAKARQRDVLVQIAPLKLGPQHPGGLIVNITDITLLKASERRRLELLGFLSHDLRSPLVSMLALTGLARDRMAAATPGLDEWLTRMENQTQTILGLADDFLHLIRAESSEDIPLREADLAEVADNALDKVWPQADAKNIRLARRYDDDTWALCNPDLLERALVNLLTNAVKYSPPDTRVEVQLIRRTGFIDCAVQDEGYGIAAQELALVFDSFRRVGERQQAEAGFGLGLAFVKAVAVRHGGEVAVDSALGQGSRFWLSVPAVDLGAE